jgi:hypothetical protein
MLREPRHTALGGDCRFRGKSLLHEREKIFHASVFGDFAFSHAHDVDRIELNFASRRRDAQKFSQVRLDTLEATWRRIPVQASEARRSLPPGPSDRATYVNRTLYADVSFALRIRYLMSHDLAGNRSLVGAEVRNVLDYSAKLARRRNPDDVDLFTVLPPASTRSQANVQ